MNVVSTTFTVHPCEHCVPTFSEILDRSTQELHRFLESVDIKARPPVHLRLQRGSDNGHTPFDLRDEARWDKSVYAWFMVGDARGGTDAYYEDSRAYIQEYWDGQKEGAEYERFRTKIRKSIDVGHWWTFRRSAGQPAIINLAYGLIAASVASLTDGFVDSIDSAWDSDRLPATADDFLSYYFRPALALG
jgi:hypothetical protein